ncbi:hypothetical protein [Terrabacter terrigena]|uniref:DUF3553 domain-containing protein n=1 Tax=Terrabacter terrigena TaxID=574718 RepID=A0ABW3MXH5_9MICO
MPTHGTPDRRRHLASSPFRPAPAPDIEEFAVGDRVSHLRHGLGVVVASSASTVTLKFESGVVRVNSPFERLTRL